MIDSRATYRCHNITVVDDDVVEGTEEVQVGLVDVPNVATVLLRPNHTIITVEDDDSKDTTLEQNMYENSQQILLQLCTLDFK